MQLSVEINAYLLKNSPYICYSFPIESIGEAVPKSKLLLEQAQGSIQ